MGAAYIPNFKVVDGTVGRVYAADGAVGTPSLSFANDTDTGFYTSAANRVNLAIAGADSVRWAADEMNCYTASSTSAYLFYRSVNTGSIQFLGGTGSGSAGLQIFAASHASSPARGNLTSNGNIKFSWNDTGISFFAATPVARPSAYTITNASTDRGLNVSGDTTAQVAAVLGTLIADLQAYGILA